MPLVKRLVGPVELGRVDKIDPHTANELELVSNHSLANVIRQLSSLSRNAEDMFMELTNEANKVSERTKKLMDRVTNVHQKVTELDATVEEVSLQELHMRKHYRSSAASDQQVVARNTISNAIVATYINCEPPPPLAKLNIYRDDQKDCVKFYTDPGYFFELWYSDIQKDIEQRKKELKEKKQHKRRPRGPQQNYTVRQPKNRTEENQRKAMGAEFVSEDQVPNIEPSRPANLEVGVPPPGITKIEDPRISQHQNQHQKQRPPQQVNRHMNGPTSRVSQNEVPQPMANHLPPTAQHNTINEYDRPNSQSPDTRRNTRTSHGQSVSRVHRPGQAPPAPPPISSTPPHTTMADHQLPPPPPAPIPVEYNHHEPSPPMVNSSMIQQRETNLRSSISPPPPPHFTHTDADFLPLPPPSPPHTSPLPPSFPTMSPDNMPLPPSPPPPPPMFDNPPPPQMFDNSLGQRDLSPPPCPPPPPIMNDKFSPPPANIPNGGIANVTLKPASSPVKDPPVIEEIDERSALLQEIRLGMWNLTKVAETQRQEQKQRPTGHLDVQTIMDRAFDMRRKAMEASDSEDDGTDDDDDWVDSVA